MRARFVSILVIAFNVAAVHGGMDCNFGTSSNFLEKVISHCPRPLIDSSDKGYCCPSSDGFYCCDAQEFAMKTGLLMIVVAVIAAIAVISIIICCISCLCCSCCPWHKRRHRGTVYGKVHTPAVVTVVQPATVQVPQPQLYQPPHSAQSPQPPPYTQEAYTKQAPYNPGYQA